MAGIAGDHRDGGDVEIGRIGAGIVVSCSWASSVGRALKPLPPSAATTPNSISGRGSRSAAEFAARSAATGAMEGNRRLLLDGLQRRERHTRPAHRFPALSDRHSYSFCRGSHKASRAAASVERHGPWRRSVIPNNNAPPRRLRPSGTPRQPPEELQHLAPPQPLARDIAANRGMISLRTAPTARRRHAPYRLHRA
jgi:hypothetical protein